MANHDSSPGGLTERQAFDALLDYGSLVKGGRVAANWMPDGRFWFVEGAPENTSIRAFNPNTGGIEPLFDVAKVRAALEAAIGRQPPYRGLPFESFAPTPEGGASFGFEGKEYLLNSAGDKIGKAADPNPVDLMLDAGLKARLTPKTFTRPAYFWAQGVVPEVLSPDGRWFAGLENNNLYLRFTTDGRREQLTTDGETDCTWDVESARIGLAPGGGFVWRTVYPWSPDGLRLFATKFDERGGGKIFHTNLLKRTDEVIRTAWTRAGEKLPEVVPFVIDVMSGRAVRQEVGAVDKMLLLLGWAPDGGALYFVQYSRDMSQAEVIAADPSTGSTQVLFSEKGDSFIRIQHELFFGRSGCTVLPDSAGFLWESERDGWKHLYHYDLPGKPVGRITQGEWAVVDVQSVDAKAGMVYFLAHHDPHRPYDVHLCRTPLTGGKIERLTDGEGIHDIQMAPDFGCFIDTGSRPDTPPRSVVRDGSGRALHSFEPMDITALKAVGWSPPEEFSVKADDGETDLWGILYKPRDFDPAKSYPVIEYIYGGPQISMAPHAFLTAAAGMSALTPALPQLGYVTVVLDARGTPERSKAFQDVTLREWRRHVTADHAAALKNLARDRPWMDLGRVGIWGHSWGGYFTFACMVDAPEVYRAGVSSAPGYDPYDLFIYEPYVGGVPGSSTKAAYEDALLFPDAPKLNGMLMIVAGSNDVGVWHSAVKMTNALIEARKDHEMVMLPGQHHGYGALHETYFIDKLVGHFDRHVKGAGDAEPA